MSSVVQPRGRLLDPQVLAHAWKQQRWTAVVFFLAVVGATLAGTLLTPKTYRAVAVIHLLPRAGQEVEVSEVVKQDEAGYMEARDRARTQLQILVSRGVREEVLRRFAEKGFTDPAPTQEGAGVLAGMVSAAPREDTQLVEVAVLHRDPEQAAVLANLFAEVYAERNLELRRGAAVDTHVWLDQERATYEQALAEAAAKVSAFRAENDLADLEERTGDIDTRLSALQEAAGDATTQRVLLESQLVEHERLLAEGRVDVLAGMFEDESLKAMAREHAALLTSSVRTLEYGERHPEHVQAVARLERMRQALAEQVASNVERERAQVQALRRQESRLERELDEVKEELLSRQGLQDTYEQLKVDEARVRGLLNDLGQRGAEVELQARTRLNDVRLVDPAIPPLRPAKPNLVLNLVVGLLAGAGGGLGLALLLYRTTDRIDGRSDLDPTLELPVLGELPHASEDLPTDEGPLRTFKDPRSHHAETLRSVRSLLDAALPQGRCRRILVTSCLEGEGKTEVAVGLAIAYAKLGRATLLIDGDLRLPRLHDVFKVRAAPGLSDGLEVTEKHMRLVAGSGIQDLDVLPCGTRVEYPNELLASPAMGTLLAAFSETHAVVIIDSPPLARVSDALGLAGQVDGVVVVVRGGRVTRTLLQRTLHQLHQVGGKVVGLLLNDVEPDDNSPGYGGGYGYRASQEAPPAALE